MQYHHLNQNISGKGDADREREKDAPVSSL
jgi:hypothetical protein